MKQRILTVFGLILLLSTLLLCIPMRKPCDHRKCLESITEHGLMFVGKAWIPMPITNCVKYEPKTETNYTCGEEE